MDLGNMYSFVSNGFHLKLFSGHLCRSLQQYLVRFTHLSSIASPHQVCSVLVLLMCVSGAFTFSYTYAACMNTQVCVFVQMRISCLLGIHEGELLGHLVYTPCENTLTAVLLLFYIPRTITVQHF